MIRKTLAALVAACSLWLPAQAISASSAQQVYEVPTTPKGPLPPIPTDGCCEHNPPFTENPPRENPPTVTTPKEDGGTLPVTGLDILVILGAAGAAGGVGFALRKNSNRK